MARTLGKIRKIALTENLPPEGSRVVGTTPDGKHTLYRQDRIMVESEPKLDKDGNQEYAKNPMSGEPLYKKRIGKRVLRSRLFYLEDQGNGNNSLVEYTPPTPEELEESAFKAKVQAMGGGALGKAMVKLGLSPEEIVESLQMLVKNKTTTGGEGSPSQEPPATPETPEPVVDTLVHDPKSIGGGWYELSNGEKYRGSEEEAREVEARITEARVQAALAPAQ